MSAYLVALVAGGWLAGWWLLWRLPGLDAPIGTTRTDDLAVIIPARNEAVSLPVLPADLAAQRPRPAEIVVVDDGSDDGTAAVARAAGACGRAHLRPPTGLGRQAVGVLDRRGVHLRFHARLPRRRLPLPGPTPGPPGRPPPASGRAPVGAAAARHAPRRQGALDRRQPRGAGRRRRLHPPAQTTPPSPSARAWCASAASTSPSAATPPCAAPWPRTLRSPPASATPGCSSRCAPAATSSAFACYPRGVRSLIEGWTKNLAAGAGTAPLSAAWSRPGWPPCWARSG